MRLSLQNSSRGVVSVVLLWIGVVAALLVLLRVHVQTGRELQDRYGQLQTMKELQCDVETLLVGGEELLPDFYLEKCVLPASDYGSRTLARWQLNPAVCALLSHLDVQMQSSFQALGKRCP